MAVTAPIIAGDGDHTMGEIAARGVWAAQVRDLLEAGCVALFGPGLTGLLLWLKWRWIRRLQRSTSEQLGVGLRNAALPCASCSRIEFLLLVALLLWSCACVRSAAWCRLLWVVVVVERSGHCVAFATPRRRAAF